MTRWVGLAVVAALLLMAWLAYFRPEIFPPGVDMAGVVYLLMALLLVSGAGYGFRRFRFEGGRAFASILFWLALIVAITGLYAWLT